ncbi:hypothetical protein [Peribacillus tepidiphilus]|uniref:hypothetical protein n=1 Tax=Peribacillus tepidiphilus TaxID=2652445 RepID=UPI0012913D49|nr:hypothetical protein [Peribacillus tepidiphilus]
MKINGIFEPSNQLSGEIYFWTELGEGEYGLIIIDVSGHGIHPFRVLAPFSDEAFRNHG